MEQVSLEEVSSDSSENFVLWLILGNKNISELLGGDIESLYIKFVGDRVLGKHQKSGNRIMSL